MQGLLDDYLVTDLPRTTGPAMTITLMRAMSAHQRRAAHTPPLPALDVNIDLLERRVAMNAFFNQHPADLAGTLAAGVGLSSESMSVTEDLTDASASLHSGCIADDFEDESGLPLHTSDTSTTTTFGCPLPGVMSSTTTSTTVAVPSRRSGPRRVSPGPRASNIVSTPAQVEAAEVRIFAACAQCRPVQISVLPTIQLDVVLAHFTEIFEGMGILPDAARWLLSARAHWLNDGAIAAFWLTGWGTLEPAFVSVWIEPGHRWPTPFVVSVPNHASRRQLLACINLPDVDRLAVSIDGILRDGWARFFHNGQVIQLRSTWHRLGTLPTHALIALLELWPCIASVMVPLAYATVNFRPQREERVSGSIFEPGLLHFSTDLFLSLATIVYTSSSNAGPCCTCLWALDSHLVWKRSSGSLTTILPCP